MRERSEPFEKFNLGTEGKLFGTGEYQLFVKLPSGSPDPLTTALCLNALGKGLKAYWALYPTKLRGVIPK